MLKGEKVILRERDWTRDFEDYVRWVNDLEVLFWDEPWREHKPRSRDEMKKRWTEAQNRPPTSFRRDWEIDTKNGVHIGGINNYRIDDANRKCAIGIIIWAKKHWNKGYGTDSVITLLRYLFDELKLHRVELTTWSGNKRMIRCAEKCGFTLEGVRRESVFCVKDGKYYDGLIFGILDRKFEIN